MAGRELTGLISLVLSLLPLVSGASLENEATLNLVGQIGGTPAFPRFLRGVAISGSFAYVAAGDAGIYVVDVSDPANPTVVGSWDSPGFAAKVAKREYPSGLALILDGALVLYSRG